MHTLQDGFIDLPDRPGFGCTLNREGLRRPHERTPEQVQEQYLANVPVSLGGDHLCGTASV